MAVDAPTYAARADSGSSPDVALRLVALSGLMAITAGAETLSVALIDGPINLRHPELAADTVRVLPGHSNVSCIRPDSGVCGHATSVAGILHMKRDGAFPGLCPDCTLLLRPIFSETTTARDIDGLPNATMEELATAIVEVVDAGARAINLSVGVAEPSSKSQHLMDQALDQAARRGVIVIAAAGNGGTLGSSAITRHPWVVPVVACDGRGQVLAISNLGASVGRNGLMAPGKDIVTLASSGGFTRFSGTSAAVPFVVGTVALLWSLFPKATAPQIRTAVAGKSRRRSVIPPLLNAWAAYEWVRQMQLPRTFSVA
jgi:subtilisin family serine protease